MRWDIKPSFDGIFTQEYLTKNYWNPTTIVEIIVGGWVVSFFETQCSYMFAEFAGRKKFSYMYRIDSYLALLSIVSFSALIHSVATTPI